MTDNRHQTNIRQMAQMCIDEELKDLEHGPDPYSTQPASEALAEGYSRSGQREKSMVEQEIKTEMQQIKAEKAQQRIRDLQEARATRSKDIGRG